MNYYRKADPLPQQALDLESFDDLDDTRTLTKTPKFSFYPLCTSEECCGKAMSVVKAVGRFQETCKDCGYYLFWDKRVCHE
jgi:hypothetical protein